MVALEKTLDLIFPQKCLECGCPSDEDLCPLCNRRIKCVENLCTRCATPLKSGTFHGCGNCIDKDYAFDVALALYKYEGLSNVLHTFKYRASIKAAKVVKRLILEALNGLPLQDTLEKAKVVTFIPMHWARRFLREFNSAEFIARTVSEHLKIPCEKLLERTKLTERQVNLSGKERWKNPEGSFKVITANLPQTLILVDDVATTLATLNEAAKTLKEAGANKVICLTLARA